MDFKPARVLLERIATGDTTYRITTAREIDTLQASIAAVGLINTPILAQRNADYIIVSGFRRVAACNRLGWNRIPARIAGANTSGADLAMVAVAENSFQRPLNILERARAAAMLSKRRISFSETAAALGIAESPEMLEKLLALNELPEPLQMAVADLSISLPVALELGALGPETAGRLAALLSQLKPSLNRQREIIGLLKDIAGREARTLEEVVSEATMKSVLADPERDRNQKIRGLLDWLRRRRFPAIYHAQEAFTRLLDDLRLGPGVSLTPSSHFEASTYTLHLAFRDLDELESQSGRLNGLLRHPALGRFLADRFAINE